MPINRLEQLRVVRPKRLYEQVAEQIQGLIQQEHLAPGSRLPSERDLATSLGVSRPSLREAMIALETLGLIDVKVGDGTFIADRRPQQVKFALEADLGPGPLEQFEVRRAVEVAVAELAADRATDEEIGTLRALVVEMGQSLARGENLMGLHKDFHEVVARASRNTIFIQSVIDLWSLRKHAMWETLRQKVENMDSWEAGIVTRHALVDCFVNRDSEGARRVMLDHFDRVGRMYFE